MWQSYKDDSNAMNCIMSSPNWRARLPMSRWKKAKAFLLGRVFKLGRNR